VSSLYLITVTGEGLLHAARTLPDFAVWVPARIHPAALYRVAVPKPQALHQNDFFAGQLDLAPPVPAAELWELIVQYGRHRSANRQTIDAPPEPEAEGDLLADISPGQSPKDSHAAKPN
jgi:hypothetical protein